MRTIDLSKVTISLTELLDLARAGTVLIHSPSGDDFLLEEAGDLDREAAALGNSEKFMAFLRQRSGESGDVPLGKAAQNRNLEEQ